MKKECSGQSLTHLINAVKENDHEAFTALYKLTYEKVLLACQRILPAHPQAQDALQETFLKVWTQAHQFDASRSGGSAWLESIARHTALDILRRQRLEPFSESEGDNTAIVEHQDGPAHLLQESQRHRAVKQSMARLKKHEQDSLWLAFFHDMSHAQLADQMGLPLGTVKSWIRRGMSQLRQQLGNI